VIHRIASWIRRPHTAVAIKRTLRGIRGIAVNLTQEIRRIKLTYHNDPNSNNPNRRALRADTSYTGWIIGGVVALAVMAGIFMMYNRNGVNTATTVNPNAPAVTTTAPAIPSTTGSATPVSPTPANR
jgi:hypothetical protein